MAKKRRSVWKRAQRFLQQAETTFASLRIECTVAEAVVEGCVRVLEYDENRILLQTVEGTLGFEGERLRLCRMAGGAALVRGRFSAVRFEEAATCL